MKHLYNIYLVSLLVIAGIMFGHAPDARSQGYWTSQSSKGFSARENAASCVIGGKIYVIGGTALTAPKPLQIFDPAANSWTTPTTTGAFTPRAGLCVEVVGGKIYAIGGDTGRLSTYDKIETSMDLVEVFDPATNTWSTPATTGTFSKRTQAGSAEIEGKIYIIGGCHGLSYGTYLSSIQVFDPATNHWSESEVGGTFAPRAGFASCIFDKKIYVFGGKDATNWLNSVEIFDPATNSWSAPAITGTALARGGLTASVVGGRIYLMAGMGGANNDIYYNTTEMFDPTTNTLTTLQTGGIATPRTAPTSAVVGEMIYLMGGYNTTNHFLNTNEFFNSPTSRVETDAIAGNYEFFPNPTTGIVTVYGSNVNSKHVTITNALGEIVMRFEAPESSDFNIDLSRVAPGLYYVRITSAGQVITQKLLRE